ncbi:Thiamine-phosphate synthase [Moorella thermoacetica]|uniref:Thiamine-phosphate synthase n=3 Tax=Neomoorella thermoacetica TaxID=1525 RepID=A0A1J5NMT5_NEOTH|nr:thiamine phosphate synthase [Moorella thermoacetica]GAF25384.1 thiamine monophosphate synthase [Moorella thermoacetica Y72]APC09402.1 thiamine-phosphate synthase [Moorella thermoacetica]OIQ09131.1 thiamine-phosphate synthase [Moorella thermoacetica]OIQ53173.1 thiamine-phosphate synthase [Moorella thermoacetica]OIQ59418.1 thiamine-phosphate synthase [Moorella thermoacetica]
MQETGTLITKYKAAWLSHRVAFKLLGAVKEETRMMPQWDLYVVITTKLGGGRPTLELVRGALAGGATAIQLREKELPARELVELGRAIRELTRDAGATFIVNDRLDIALAVEADGLHIGQEDLPAPVARKLLGPEKILGVSAGTTDEARQAEADGADYLGVGSIFATGSKGDAGSPIGLEGLRAIRAAVKIPIVGIGGINPDNAAGVIAAGADGVSVISAVIGAADVAAAARRLREVVTRARGK